MGGGMSVLILIIIIVVAFYFGSRMDRLERQLEDVHDSLRKILTLPPDVRQAELEADLAAKKEWAEQAAKDQRRNERIALTVMVILLAVGLLWLGMSVK
jgi:Flp pilus assembly protein TadB